MLLLENTRFHAGEEKNDPDFAKQLAALGDIFVNDAFSAAHRAHATTEGRRASAARRGRPLDGGRSSSHLQKALGNPERPLMAVVGGAKVSTKIELLQNLVSRVETLVIGGAMANTFLAAEGVAIGKSLYEPDHLETARKVIHMANEERRRDPACPAMSWWPRNSRQAPPTAPFRAGEIAADEMVLDVGPASIQAFKNRLVTTKTLVWNGPFGAFEIEPFDTGTVAAAQGRGGSRPKPAIFCRWRAAATRWRRWPMPASKTISPMSRPRAARSWNGWKARNCPAWKRLKTAKARG